MEFNVYEMNDFKCIGVSMTAMNFNSYKEQRNSFYFNPYTESFDFDASRCWFPAEKLLEMRVRLFAKFIEPAFYEFIFPSEIKR